MSVLVVVACGRGGPPKESPKIEVARDAAVVALPDAGPALPAHQAYANLGDAIAAIVPPTTRVIGFGELHARVDRAAVRSSLSHFTEALPAFGARISDLVVETWIIDPKCGAKAVKATAKVEATVKRPEATKSEIAQLADAARAAKIQPHAMTLACKDYATIAPENGEPDPIAMLTLTTRELSRVVMSAVKYRDKQADHRPLIALYGGALHNDRFPAAAVAEWSYADSVDLATDGAYLEIDLIVPELAEGDSVSQKQPWFPLVADARQVLVWQRGERSYVVILPRA
ncbi:MAG: hypothetical protein H0T89_11530 [Deltaproteobacteria bacterium]|nr:hypothetical protein [Deltaproteobacteria bacterium]MDQ3365743.1 hypothetical protein [Myxococcota bacterium]